ncbi:GmrSD restriction endonuclease domain-containing protein [Rhizobium leguminosarum]
MSITQLVQEIDAGEIVLPAIQRDFVWSEDQIETLLDSLLRGYPIGIALLWETYEPIQVRRFSKDYRTDIIHKFSDNPKGRRVRMVLDGQQRLNSLYVGLKGTYNGKTLFFDVLSGRHSEDYSEQKFRFKFATDSEIKAINLQAVEAPDRANAYWLSLGSLISVSPIEMARTRADIVSKMQLEQDDQFRLEANLLEAQHALTTNSELLKMQVIDANLPTDSSARKTAFDILEIFVRINRQGVPLKRSDLIVSMLRLYWPEASDLLPTFIAELNSSSNLNFDNDFVIRCMFAVSGLGTRLDFELLRNKKNIEKLKDTYEGCFDAIRSTRDFIKNDCKIDSTRLLGGISTLVPFVFYLYHSPKKSLPLRSKTDATRAIFLFGFSKLFSQHIESRTAAYIRDILDEQTIAAGGKFPINETIQHVAWKTNFVASDRSLFNNNHELALALVQNLPGGPVAYVGNLPEVDHIFPKSTLNERGFDWQKINDLANFWILPRGINRNKTNLAPKEYLKDVDASLLEDALIDRDLLTFGKFERFLKVRSARIVEMLQARTKLTAKLFEALELEDVYEGDGD